MCVSRRYVGNLYMLLILYCDLYTSLKTKVLIITFLKSLLKLWKLKKIRFQHFAEHNKDQTVVLLNFTGF